MFRCVILWLVCIPLSTVVASECEVCLRGKCLALNQLKAAEDITASSSAIDLKNNILYAVRNETLQAIHLDNDTVNTIPTKEQNRITLIKVDQVTADVYYTYGGASVYKYIPSGETETINQRIGKHMWVHNETLYWPGLAKGLNYLKGSSRKTVDAFKNVKVRNLIFDKLGNMYVGTSGKVYKVTPDETKTIVTSSSYGLRVDGNGDVYLVDSKKHWIYQLDLNTEQLFVAGSFGEKYYKYTSYFMFDKYNNIIAKPVNLGVHSFIYFKYTSDQCTISDTDSNPYITNISSPKLQDGPKNVVEEIHIPHFGD